MFERIGALVFLPRPGTVDLNQCSAPQRCLRKRGRQVASSGKSEETFKQIEETQQALRDSIEQSMALAARSEQLIKQHREQVKEPE